jgi:transcriptional regulator with XRE-family HTH domain
VLAWRVVRGMTQSQLARAAKIPRPNLSAIERGDREVTLRTLRALALALDVRPGALVDGEMPGSGPPLTRAAMERIAKATANGTSLVNPRESKLAQWLQIVLSSELPSRPTDTGEGHQPSIREREYSYLLLKGSVGRDVFATLCARTRDRLSIRAPRTN